MSDAMGKVANTAALIVDLRQNGGGNGDTVIHYMSYLFDEKTLLSETFERSSPTPAQQWTRPEVPGQRYGASRPLFVLTSRLTFSAAEAFAYNVQTLKRGTIVGETTAGAGHFNAFVKIGKQFVLSVAVGMTRSPVTGTNWDGVGVKPDIPTTADDALDVALDRARKAAKRATVERRDSRL
jgi:C-terminal processing protease CtpA/Prc